MIASWLIVIALLSAAALAAMAAPDKLIVVTKPTVVAFFASVSELADAEAILHQTQVFAFGGMPPKRQVQAFNVVFEQPDAVSRLHRLAGAASAAGRLYALAGLLLLDRPAAVRLQGTLAADPQRIMVVDADVYYKKPISGLAATIERRDAGTWFRQVRDETMAYYAASR